jgi:hypothetical protein
MQFDFYGGAGVSGYLAFTSSAITTATGGSSSARPLLLVADHSHDALHIVDVVGQTHAGYLAPPGSIAGPRGVAASGASPLVAVSAWKNILSDRGVVWVYRGSGGASPMWEAVRVIGAGFGGPGAADGQLMRPCGLRFSGDGLTMCVADTGNGRANMFRVGDGGLVRHIATDLRNPVDVEEVEGGWLVACLAPHSVEFVSNRGVVGGAGGARPSLGKPGGGYGSGDGEFHRPSALAVVPGLGLVVREVATCRLQVFATPDAVAMASMSRMRIAWMGAVARAALQCPP